MGRRNFRKKISIAVSAFTAVFISVMILASSSELSGDSDNSGGQDIYEEELPTPINKLLSNQISNLEETEKLDRQIEKFLKRWEIKGASFAVMKDEKLIYAKGYGWADEEKGERMEVSHILRIASVSKLITAAGIMKLCEDSKLSLDDKVFGPSGILNDSCFQNIRDKRMLKITVEQLLRHKAGFTLHRGDPLFSVATLMKWEKWDVPEPAQQGVQPDAQRLPGHDAGDEPGPAGAAGRPHRGCLQRGGGGIGRQGRGPTPRPHPGADGAGGSGCGQGQCGAPGPGQGQGGQG